MPAATLLGGRDGALDADLGVVLGDDGIPGVFAGDGVKGVENGCAAEVDVAGGGLSGRRCRGEVERGRIAVERERRVDRVR